MSDSPENQTMTQHAIEFVAKPTLRQSYFATVGAVVDFKRNLTHSHKSATGPVPGCLKCDINQALAAFEEIEARHFPK